MSPREPARNDAAWRQRAGGGPGPAQPVRLLRGLSRLVPWPRRLAWLREWTAEATYERQLRHAHGESRPRRRLAAAATYASAGEDALRLLMRTRNGTMLLRDCRHGARALVAEPLWSLAAITTLAVGIGATTTVFSLVYGVLLQPLPFHEPGRLLVNSDPEVFSHPLYEQLRERQQPLEDLGAWTEDARVVRLDGRPERISGAIISAAVLPTLGVQPAIGGGIQEADDRDGAAATVLLSHVFWNTRFGGDPDVVGELLVIDDQPHTIVGVMPADFAFPTPEANYWRSMAHANRSDSTWYLRVVGRVGEDFSLEAARAAIAQTPLSRPDSEDGPRPDLFAAVEPMHDRLVGPARPLLLTFQGAILAVLLIACLNVTNLTLARAADREGELTVRAALGAGRGRLVRLALTETILLSLVGGLLGVGVAHLSLRALLAVVPTDVPLQERIGISPPVLLAALGLALAAGLLVGMVPAWRATRLSLRDGLGGGRQATDTRGRRRLRQGLVACELGLALALLVGGGLLLSSFVTLWNVDPGVEPEGVLLVSFPVPEAQYPGKEPKVELYRQLLERLETLPGIERAAGAGSYPFTGAYSNSDLEIDGLPDAAEINSEIQTVTPGYFGTMGVPLLAGRDFTAADGADAKVVIVNETIASSYFPGESALGERIRGIWGHEEDWMTIIGVVGNIQHRGLDVAAAPQLYQPYSVAQWPWPLAVSVRLSDPGADVGDSLRAAVAAVDDDIPVPRIVALNDLLGRSVGRQRFLSVLSGVFAGIALLLAVVGVYGVVAYSVSRRTRELGVRLALGAAEAQVTRQVVLEGLRVTLIGVGLGLLLAVATTRVLQSYLFGLSARDPLVFVLAALALGAATLLASYGPARRAGRLDPVEALRSE